MRPLIATFKDRLMFLRLLRDTGKGVLAALIAEGLVGALLPAAGAAATGWLLSNLNGDLSVPLLTLGAVFLAGQVSAIASRWIGVGSV